MALTTVLDSLDGVDDAVKAFYVQKDDKYILDLEGVDAHPTVTGLKGAYAAEKNRIAKLTEERDALKAAAAAPPKKPDDQPDFAKVKGQYDADLAAARKEVEDITAKLFAATVQRDMTTALAAAGVTNPALAEGALAILSRAPMVDGKVQTDMGPMDVTEYVKKWAATPQGAAYVTPAQGGGAKGSGTPAKGKTMPESDFYALNARERAKAMAAGTTLI